MSTIEKPPAAGGGGRIGLFLQRFTSTGFLHVLLVIIAFSMVLPFVWMLLTSIKPLAEVGSPSWVPTKAHWDNYTSVFDTEVRSDYTGVVKEIVPGKQVVLLDAETNAPVTVKLDEKASIRAEKAIIQPEQVTPGQQVQVTREAGKGVPFGRYYWNSILVAAWVTFLQVFTSSLAAFAFSRIQWPGRNKVFLLYLGTMMLPGLVMMIPSYQIMIYFGLVDTLTGLILPAAFTAFGTFLLRQFMLTIPTELDEAAEIDGASKWRVYWEVILPLSRPGLIVLTIFTFMGNYRSFFWPLVMLRTMHKYTLPIGMMYFDSTRGQAAHLMMAAATMMIIPLIVLFLALQKYLVKGIQLGAVKG